MSKPNKKDDDQIPPSGILAFIMLIVLMVLFVALCIGMMIAAEGGK